MDEETTLSDNYTDDNIFLVQDYAINNEDKEDSAYLNTEGFDNIDDQDIMPEKKRTITFNQNQINELRKAEKEKQTDYKPQEPDQLTPTGVRRNPRRKRSKQEENRLDFILNENSDFTQRIAIKILFGESVPSDTPVDILGYAIRELERRRDALLSKGAYHESVKAAKAAERAKTIQLEAAKKEAQQCEMADIKIRRGHLKTDFRIAKHISRARINDMKKLLSDRLQELLRKHEEELEKFEEKWKSEPVMRMYKKRSQRLVHMRIVEKKLLLAQRYDESELQQKIANKIEKDEYKTQREKYQNDYKEAKERLLERQKKELDIFYCSSDVRKKILQKKIKNEKNHLRCRKRALEAHEKFAEDQEKVWNVKHRGEEATLCQGPFGKIKRSRFREVDLQNNSTLLPYLAKEANLKKQFISQ